MAVLSITPASVLASSAAPISTVKLAALVTVTQGQALYRLADGTAGLADSNAATPANSFLGIALSAGSPGQYVTYTAVDTAFTPGATLTSGFPVFIANTAGALTQTIADLAAGSTVIVIGCAISTTQMTLAGPVTSGSGVV